MDSLAIELLGELLASLPPYHRDIPGVQRAIEVLKAEDTPAPGLHLILRIEPVVAQAWPHTRYQSVCACGERCQGEGTHGAQVAWSNHLRETEKA